GASWTFVAWGLYHGIVLCLFRALGIRDATPSGGLARYAFRLALMFHLTCAGWLLFRADNFAAVTDALRLIFTHFEPSVAVLTPLVLVLFYGSLLFAFELFVKGEERFDRLLRSPWAVQGACLTYFVGMWLVFRAGQAFEFIYFQF
ncbi:MAG TPA: hypothetical protein VK524_10300, partial [Polyangiaceae bacterium]|nr:hypothetical protein [Polyangiaceae bacterium]